MFGSWSCCDQIKKHDIKLIDFGLALTKPTATSLPRGYSPKYAAPEVLEGKPPIPETDLYGAGMVLLYALGGHPLSKYIPSDVPDAVADYCMHLLNPDPLQRPQWKHSDPLELLRDARQSAFGRRHRGMEE